MRKIRINNREKNELVIGISTIKKREKERRHQEKHI
jgi:hypothetical protein